MAAVKEEDAKKKSRNVIGPDFVAPDGGWGWMIVLAAGCSNLCTFPVLQQFGLLFRDRFASLGISTSEITTIINLNSTLTSLIGLANGPMFRRFTYRQVSFCGAVLVSIALLITSFANSVPTYIISFSVLYGTGVGISTSANALALNTYFKVKRRIATGFSWTSTALGPIVMPHIVTALVLSFGIQGAVFLMAGFALNAVVCSLLLQPVQWHTKKAKDNDNADLESNGTLVKEPFKESSYFDDKLKRSKSRSLVSSQYIYNEDDEEVPGYEIIDPGTPMLSRANDGWYSAGKRSLMGSRLSLASNRTGKYFDPDSRKASTQNLARSKKNSITNLNDSLRNSKYSNPSSKKNSNQNLSKAGLVAESRSRVNSISNLAEISRSRRNSGTNLNAAEYNEIRKSRRRHQSIKIEESEAENCPSNIAPQDLKIEDVEDANEAKPLVTQESVEETNEVKKKTDFLSIEETEGDKTPTTRSALRRDASYTGNLRSNKSYADLKDQEKKTVTIEGVSEAKYFKDNHSIKSLKNSEYRKRNNTFNLEKEVLRVASKKLEEYAELNLDDNGNDPQKDNEEGEDQYDYEENDEDQTLMDEEEMEKQLSFIDKIVIFFDLDLLRDFTYVNLMLGITFANFAELNFSILTPFVLGDFGFTQPEIALVMSLLGGCDIGVRFIVPFIAGKIGWENRTFFLFGVLSMACGRVILAHFHTFPVTIMVACIIGCGKGLRTVFMALVIPSHVPLERLPGATGLQLLSAGLFYLIAGPLIGWIRDATNYTVTLHFLNIMTYSVAISWGLEKLHSVRKQRRKEAELNSEL